MSHNTDPERAARRHPMPLIAIALALAAAALAAFWFLGADPQEEGDVARTEAESSPPTQVDPNPATPPPAGGPEGTVQPGVGEPAAPQPSN